MARVIGRYSRGTMLAAVVVSGLRAWAVAARNAKADEAAKVVSDYSTRFTLRRAAPGSPAMNVYAEVPDQVVDAMLGSMPEGVRVVELL